MERAYALGVDFGTESGRALLLDLHSGAELAVERGPLPPRRDRPRAAGQRRAAPARLGAAASRRLGRGARAGDPGGARAGARGARGGGRARRRLHLVHRAAGGGRRAAAVPAGALALAPPCVAEAVEAPRRAAGRRPAQRGRGRARRAVPRALRRPDLLGVVLPEADRAVARGSRRLRRLQRLHRGDRLDRLVPDGRRAPPELHRRLQGDVVAGGRAPAGRVLRGRLPRIRPARRQARHRVRSARHARRVAAAGARRAPRPARAGRRRGRQRRFVRLGPRRRSRVARHVRDGRRHVDLRPRGRSGGGAPARHHGGRARRHPARALRLRGGAGRRRRHARVVPRDARAARRRARGVRAGGGRDRPRGERARGARLVERQPHDPRRRRPQRRARRADAADHARADLPRAARVDRLRQPADHRELRGARPEAEGDSRLRRDRREEPADDAAARRHERSARERARLDADPRARLCAVRRGRRGLLR